MIDKKKIEAWIKGGAFMCGTAIRIGDCEICGKPILRGDYYFQRFEKIAHFDCVLSEQVLQELEIERGEVRLCVGCGDKIEYDGSDDVIDDLQAYYDSDENYCATCWHRLFEGSKP